MLVLSKAVALIDGVGRYQFNILNCECKNHNYTEIIALKKINPARAAKSQLSHQEVLRFLPLEEHGDLSGILVNLVHQTSRSEKTPNDTVGSLRSSRF